jgi:hypothetical protein
MGRLLRLAELQKGIHDNCFIKKVDIEDRKGKNGIINKMVYVDIAKLGKNGKPVAHAEVAWWKPDPASEYFVTNLQELCLQLHNMLAAYVGDEEAFKAFDGVFEDVGIKDYKEIENKKWKQSEVNKLVAGLSKAFKEAIDPYVGDTENLIRIKLTTNYKGEGVEIPKYGLWIEPMSKEKTDLYFTDNEVKTHSKAGIVSGSGTASTPASTVLNESTL